MLCKVPSYEFGVPVFASRPFCQRIRNWCPIYFHLKRPIRRHTICFPFSVSSLRLAVSRCGVSCRCGRVRACVRVPFVYHILNKYPSWLNNEQAIIIINNNNRVGVCHTQSDKRKSHDRVSFCFTLISHRVTCARVWRNNALIILKHSLVMCVSPSTNSTPQMIDSRCGGRRHCHRCHRRQWHKNWGKNGVHLTVLSRTETTKKKWNENQI